MEWVPRKIQSLVTTRGPMLRESIGSYAQDNSMDTPSPIYTCRREVDIEWQLIHP